IIRVAVIVIIHDLREAVTPGCIHFMNHDRFTGNLIIIAGKTPRLDGVELRRRAADGNLRHEIITAGHRLAKALQHNGLTTPRRRHELACSRYPSQEALVIRNRMYRHAPIDGVPRRTSPAGTHYIPL